MTRYLLDTDHLSLLERGHPPLLSRLATLPPDFIAVSVVTVEESIRGRLAILARPSIGEARVRAYMKFLETVHFFNTVPVLHFDSACEQRFQELRSQRLHVGTRDLRIAATALTQNLTVVTRNRRDFERVPDLRIEDWSMGDTGTSNGSSGVQ
jgi:tRNA(fMet)-specific endonuclease VapC